MIRGALVVALVACRAPQHASAPALDGLWTGDRLLDVGPAGPIEISETPAGYRAVLGALSVQLAGDGDELTGKLGVGELRLHRAGDRLAGHWIQPATALTSTFATPLALVRGPDQRYRGVVAPLPSEVHLALVIHGEHAFVRETARNLGKSLGTLTVRRDAKGIELRDAAGAVVATAVPAGDHLHFELPSRELAVDMSRRGRDDAPWFYARPTTARLLTPPAADGDGWTVSTFEAAGLDRAAIEAIVREVAADVPDGPHTRALHALVIARHGKLVVEEYFAGDRADTLHDLRSAAKSISTTLAGIAIDHEQLALGSPVYETLGAPIDDPRKRDIKLEHLLSMSTGLACDDGDDASPGNEDRMESQTAQPDWYRFTLDLPVAAPPGTARYCSGTMNLVGAMVAARTHAWLPDLIDAQLFAPLDITRYAINLMPDGQAYFGGGYRLRARDFAKLAQLFLDGGTWRGRRIVSTSWVTAATAAHASLNKPDDYGYGWWREVYPVAGAQVEAFFASGNGGQIAMAIPKLDLVVAFHAGNYAGFTVWKHFLDDLVPRVMRAVRP